GGVRQGIQSDSVGSPITTQALSDGPEILASGACSQQPNLDVACNRGGVLYTECGVDSRRYRILRAGSSRKSAAVSGRIHVNLGWTNPLRRRTAHTLVRQ